MTSYETLSPAMREQLDTLLADARAARHEWRIGPAQAAYLRETIANLILTCLLLDKQQSTPHTMPTGGPCCVCGVHTFLTCMRCGLPCCVDDLALGTGRMRCPACAAAESAGAQ